MNPCHHSRSLLFTLVFLSAGSLISAAEMHTWTNLTGQQIMGEMIGMDIAARAVKVRRSDGLDFNLPIANLSAEDIAYASAEWRKMQSNGTVVAATKPQSGALNLKLLPPRFIIRCSEATRHAAVSKHGGDDRIEAAVTKSLDWLKSQQKETGGWGTSNSIGYTALVLQAYTGHGEGVESSDYGATVQKGCDFLIKKAAANPEGMLASSSSNGAGTYEHGMATTALGELYILARAGSQIPLGLETTFQKAVQLIIDNQNQRGSWTYGGTEAGFPIAYNKSSKGEDLSLANWQIQALAVAKESGIQVSGLDACIKNAMSYLETKQTKDGGYGSDKKDMHYNQWNLSGGAILGQQILGSATKTSKGIRFLRQAFVQDPPDWQKNFNLYAWVSNTSAFFNSGGDDWKFYVSTVMPQIQAAQSADGSFQKGTASWPASGASDPNYRQALCTLQLEVFYRYFK
ncbi:MAG: hypothetical protein ABL974_02440 [Prosthecobacter sp.]